MKLIRVTKSIPSVIFPDGSIWGFRDGKIVKCPIEWGVDEEVVSYMPNEAKFIHCLYRLDDGAILISCGNRKVYHFKSAILTECFQFPTGYALKWSFTHSGNTVFVSEYGEKMGSNNSRRIYKSVDGGVTFVETLQADFVSGAHIHKIIHDPVSDILWVSQGDPPYSKLFKSVGSSHSTKELINTIQPTAAINLTDYILWGQDSNPNGVYRQRKSDNVFDLVMDFSEMPQASDYIFDMYKDASNNVYFATVDDVSPNISVMYKGSPPDYTNWELIWSGKKLGVYEIVVASENMMVAKIKYGRYSRGAVFSAGTNADRTIRRIL